LFLIYVPFLTKRIFIKIFQQIKTKFKLKCVTPINLSPHDNNEVNDEINVEVHVEANIEVNLVANIEANVAANDVPFNHAPTARSVARYAAARMAHVTFNQDYAEANDTNFQRVFAGRDFSRLPVSQYIFRLQGFHFRQTTPAFRNPLFNQWLVRQPSHNELLHAPRECDVPVSMRLKTLL
jgi:hypothetical protein